MAKNPTNKAELMAQLKELNNRLIALEQRAKSEDNLAGFAGQIESVKSELEALQGQIFVDEPVEDVTDAGNADDDDAGFFDSLF